MGFFYDWGLGLEVFLRGLRVGRGFGEKGELVARCLEVLL